MFIDSIVSLIVSLIITTKAVLFELDLKPNFKRIDGAIQVRFIVDPTFDSLVGSGWSDGLL